MGNYGKSIIKIIPSIKILLPFIVGILLQYQFNISNKFFVIQLIMGLLFFVIYFLLSTAKKFFTNWLIAVAVSFIFIALGGLISYQKNIMHQPTWIGNYYQPNTPVLLTIQEPLVTKEKSYKAVASANAVYINGKWQSTTGNVLLYFKKDSTTPTLQYGSQIVFVKTLNTIANAGNPGGFNYARYCMFQNITYQAFLNDNSFITLPTTKTNWLQLLIINAQTKVLSILKNNIKGTQELGVAEALLIGYRNDLDKNLVQQYSNTGVVHIIAISGLHLGMIYFLLLLLFKPFAKFQLTKFIKPIVILIVLWGFSCMAGAAPSILRSAVMFTFLVIAESCNKRTNMYNSLTASAFVILLINPFSLWDVGFQLSYTAVLSIVIFQKHINNWFYFKNKLLHAIWKLNAITLSAQFLTLPIVLYHFHQFPTLFIVTNIFAVPFSGIILYDCLLLLITSFIPAISTLVGKSVELAIWLLNQFIITADALPYSVYKAIQINNAQVWFLFIVIAAFAYWLMKKSTIALLIGLVGILFFLIIRTEDFYNKNNQQKMIVYNISNYTGIDIVQGRKTIFIGDTELIQDGFLKNFHIAPTRVLQRTTPINFTSNNTYQNNIITINHKNILIVDNNFKMPTTPCKLPLDVIVFCKNPKIYLETFSQYFACKQYVFDASNPSWKIAYWQKDANNLHLRFHSTASQGAFVMNL